MARSEGRLRSGGDADAGDPPGPAAGPLRRAPCPGQPGRGRAGDRWGEFAVLFSAGFAPSGVGSGVISPDGRFLAVNPALCAMLDRSEGELRALRFTDVTHPDDVAEGQRLSTSLLSGEIRTAQIEKRYVRPDGAVVWGLLSISLVGGDGSGPRYFFTQVQDITQRKRAEEEAQRRARQQAAVATLGSRALAGADPEALLTEAASVVVEHVGSDTARVLELRAGPDGDAVVVRAAAGWPEPILGRTAPATPGSQAWYAVGSREPVVVDDLRRETRFSPDALLLEHGLVSGVSVVITVGGAAFGVLTAHTAEHRRFSPDDVNFVQAVANVVAGAIERRRHEDLQERAHRQDRLAAVGRVAAGVAHDFNNIVSVISLYAELLESQRGLDDAGRTHLAAIGQQVDRALSLVWHVLDFAHRTPPRLVDVDLVSFLDDLVPTLARTLPDRVTLTLDCEGRGRHVVRADLTRLQQILLNLVGNARDAVDAVGEVRITVRGCGGSGERRCSGRLPSCQPHVRLEVVDDGCGMSPEVAGRVFEPFFTTKAPGRGTGLGLAQVQALVTDLGGDVGIDTAVGAGTTVGICLPSGASATPDAPDGPDRDVPVAVGLTEPIAPAPTADPPGGVRRR